MRKRLAAFLLAFTIASGSVFCASREAYAMDLTAVNYIWSMILYACGVNVPNDDVSTVADGISSWIRGSYAPTDDYYKSLVLLDDYANDKLGWGTTFDGFGMLVKAAKLYLQSQPNYGTDAGIDGITVTVSGSDYSKSFSAKYGGGYAESYFGRENYLCSSEYTSRSINGPTSGKHLQSDYFLTDGYDRSVRYCFFKGNGSYILYKYGSGGYTYGGNVLGVISYYNDGSFAERTAASSVDIRYDYVDTYLPLLPLPVYDTDSAMRAYLANGILGNPLNGITSDGLTHALLVPVVSRPFVQKRAITKVGPLTLPADYSSAVAHREKVATAVTPEDMAAALSPAVEIVYENTAVGEEDKTYPWIPDITRPLGVIRDILDALSGSVSNIKDWVQGIPAALVDLKHAVVALHETIITSVSDALEKAKEDVTNGMDYFVPVDLTAVFPFCLPFDMIDFINVLSAEPVAPCFTFPINYPDASGWKVYELNIDLSVFDSAASLLRTMECLAFIVGLVIITRGNMIRG